MRILRLFTTKPVGKRTVFRGALKACWGFCAIEMAKRKRS